jgi:hypothetical protein
MHDQRGQHLVAIRALVPASSRSTLPPPRRRAGRHRVGVLDPFPVTAPASITRGGSAAPAFVPTTGGRPGGPALSRCMSCCPTTRVGPGGCIRTGPCSGSRRTGAPRRAERLAITVHHLADPVLRRLAAAAGQLLDRHQDGRIAGDPQLPVDALRERGERAHPGLAAHLGDLRLEHPQAFRARPAPRPGRAGRRRRRARMRPRGDAHPGEPRRGLAVLARGRRHHRPALGALESGDRGRRSRGSPRAA